MHHSRIWGIVIDCDDINAGIAFWTAALGVSVQAHEPPYVTLEPPPGGLRVLLQYVPEPKTAKTRVHLDIETDDVEAEATRLEALGGRRKEPVADWWVMEDPCGNEFCVIPTHSDDFLIHARRWD